MSVTNAHVDATNGHLLLHVIHQRCQALLHINAGFQLMNVNEV